MHSANTQRHARPHAHVAVHRLARAHKHTHVYVHAGAQDGSHFGEALWPDTCEAALSQQARRTSATADKQHAKAQAVLTATQRQLQEVLQSSAVRQLDALQKQHDEAEGQVSCPGGGGDGLELIGQQD